MDELIKNKKVVYFADCMFTYDINNIEDEWKSLPEKQLAVHDIKFEKVHFVETPPFNKMTYDILFFDYGGMSMGNGLLDSFCRQIIRESELYPNRYYVMVSTFTSYAKKDALETFGNKDNIYLSVDDFAKDFKRNEL